MIRVFVLYEGEPDPERYQRHVDEFIRPIERATFRHGKVFGSPTGESRFKYYGEYEFPDMQTFREVARSPEFAASGKDAMEMGIPFSVHFAEIE